MKDLIKNVALSDIDDILKCIKYFENALENLSDNIQREDENGIYYALYHVVNYWNPVVEFIQKRLERLYGLCSYLLESQSHGPSENLYK